MRSSANAVKGQGVGSAYDEQVALCKKYLSSKYIIRENSDSFADITHFHTINPTYYFSLPWVKHMGVCVGYVHFLPETVENSLQLPRFSKWAFYRYLIAFYKTMDYLVTVNPYFIDRLTSYGIPREKIYYIPNYVSDTEFHTVSDKEKQNLRKKYGIEDKFTVMCAGQLQTRKGIFDFVECAKSLPDVQFVWAGGFSFGKITDGYEKIKKLVKHPPENVKFPGIIDRKYMNDIYNISDVMFLPSYEELFPMTVLEAMCCEKPILLRDIDIYKNILFDFYLKGTDVDSFVNQIKLLQSSEEYYSNAAKMSAKGHNYYNEKHIADMWNKLYTDVLNEKLPLRFKRQQRFLKRTRKKSRSKNEAL